MMDFTSYYLGICTITVIFLLYYAYKLEKAVEKLKKEKDELNVQRGKDIASMFDQYINAFNKDACYRMIQEAKIFGAKKK